MGEQGTITLVRYGLKVFRTAYSLLYCRLGTFSNTNIHTIISGNKKTQHKYCLNMLCKILCGEGERRRNIRWSLSHYHSEGWINTIAQFNSVPDLHLSVKLAVPYITTFCSEGRLNEDIGRDLVRVSVDLWHDCAQFTLFDLIVAEAVYSSIVSYWGHKLSRQLSPLFSPSTRAHNSNCFAQYIGLYCIQLSAMAS